MQKKGVWILKKLENIKKLNFLLTFDVPSIIQIFIVVDKNLYHNGFYYKYCKINY